MVRVCVSMPVLILLLAGCASEKPEAAETSRLNASAPRENILACTGLPLAGQKCGLALPQF